DAAAAAAGRVAGEPGTGGDEPAVVVDRAAADGRLIPRELGVGVDCECGPREVLDRAAERGRVAVRAVVAPERALGHGHGPVIEDRPTVTSGGVAEEGA